MVKLSWPILRSFYTVEKKLSFLYRMRYNPVHLFLLTLSYDFPPIQKKLPLLLSRLGDAQFDRPTPDPGFAVEPLGPVYRYRAHDEVRATLPHSPVDGTGDGL